MPLATFIGTHTIAGAGVVKYPILSSLPPPSTQQQHYDPSTGTAALLLLLLLHQAPSLHPSSPRPSSTHSPPFQVPFVPVPDPVRIPLIRAPPVAAPAPAPVLATSTPVSHCASLCLPFSKRRRLCFCYSPTIRSNSPCFSPYSRYPLFFLLLAILNCLPNQAAGHCQPNNPHVPDLTVSLLTRRKPPASPSPSSAFFLSPSDHPHTPRPSLARHTPNAVSALRSRNRQLNTITHSANTTKEASYLAEAQLSPSSHQASTKRP